MGVTIHFEGQLRDESAYNQLIDAAESFAKARGWVTRSIAEANTILNRVRSDDETEWDYEGSTKGIEIRPAP